MHPTQRARLQIERDVALDKARIEAVSFEFAPAPGPGEEPAFILESLNFNSEGAFKFCLRENHQRTLTSGIGTINLPPQFRMNDICSMISSLKFHGKMKT